MQNSQIPTKIVQPWAAGSSNIVTVPVTTGATDRASWTKGFQDSAFQPYGAGGTAVRGVDEQGALNQISAAVRWMTAGAQFPWDSTFESDSHVGGYPLGSVIGSSDYLAQWRSTAENNVTNPETGTGGSVPTWLPSDASVTSITVAGANITLTPLQAKASVIVLTGTLSANINITFPLFPGKKWAIVNNINTSSNLFTVQLVTSGSINAKGPLALLSNGYIGSTCEIVASSDGTLEFSNGDTTQYVHSTLTLRNIDVANSGSNGYPRRVRTAGYYSAGDGCGGLEYVWKVSSPYPTGGYFVDNGGTIIVPGNGGTGAWVAVPGQDVTACHFGADPSFTNDSTSAINKYMTWCAQQAATHGGLVGSSNGYIGRLPAGRYKCSSGSLQAQAGVVLKGDGWGTSPIEGARYNPPIGTTIEFTGSNSVGIDGRIGTNPVTGMGFRDMVIKNSGSVVTGVYIQYAAELCFVNRCFITGFASIGLNVDNTSDFIAKGNILYNNGTNGIKIGANTNNIDLDFNYFNTTGSVALYLSGANAVTVGDNNSFYGLPADGSAIYVDSSCVDISIKNPMWDFSGGTSGHTVTFLNVQSGTNITLDGLRKKAGVSTSNSQAVNFVSAAVSCSAKLGVFGNFPPGINNSTSSRITYNSAYEAGVYALGNSNQVIAASTPTTITFATEQFDPKNEWSSNVFTPNDQGYYNLTLTLYAQNTASGSSNDVTVDVKFKDITANAVIFEQAGIGISNNNYANIGFSGPFQAAPGHQYSVIVTYTTGASGALSILTNSGQGAGATQIQLKRFS